MIRLPIRNRLALPDRSGSRGCGALTSGPVWLRVGLLVLLPVVASIAASQDALPLLREHCIDCHGPDAAESNLRLDTLTHALRGGDSGEPAIVPGNSDRSDLLTRLLSEDPDHRMPPDGPALSDEAIDQIRNWIDDAQQWQAAVAELSAVKSEHWSFQPIERPTPPSPAGVDQHPVDAFLNARLAAAGLEMSPPASRRRLIRRAFLVLHGLPPSVKQVEAFVHDDQPRAWERWVEELLASPQYGERMATQWLDLVHFGETHGFETNRERPTAWHYRDWVIDAFNDDKPYDEFVVEQLAGDAVGADVGTGFLVAGPYDMVKGSDPQLRLVQRQDELADMINTTGTAFLGLTLGCARCHNHKFDPVSQTDFYAMQAVFAGVQHAERTLPISPEAQRQIDTLDQQIASLRKELAAYASTTQTRPAVDPRGNREVIPPVEAKFVRFTIQATNQSQPCIDELEIYSGEKNVGLAESGAKATSNGDFVHPLHKLPHINDGQHGNDHSWIASRATGGWVQIELPQPMSIDRIEWARDREGHFSDRLATDYRIETSLDGKTWALVASAADRLPYDAKQTPRIEYSFTGLPDAEAAAATEQLRRLEASIEQRAQLSQTPKVYAGSFRQPGPTHRLYRGEPGSPRETVAPAAIQALTKLQLPADAPEQQRRLAIARWIASEDHPLTARVMANRIWQFHFGTGIVDTPSDFGGNGTAPTHPELLDWLADEFIRSGWSIKHLHRLILLSAAWQQDSRPQTDGLAIDADSRLLWRYPIRRLDAESIRDSLLAVSGKLNLQAGGPGFSAFEIEPENVRHYFPKTTFGPEDWRRMVYMTRVRQERDAVFGVFDCPDFSQVVPQRSRSTTPLQALNLLNSAFVIEQAKFLVERLDRDGKSPPEKVALAYQLCFSRAPDEQELQTALAFIQQTDWQQFARAMLNANELLFIP